MRDPILYRLLRPILVLVALICLPKIINKKNIPKKGRVILAGNHTNARDGFLLGTTTKRCVRFVAKDKLTKGKFGFFFKAMGAIPVNREIKDNTVIPAVVNLLNHDRLVGIFPEGTINRTDDIIIPFKKGVIHMSLESGAPIIPFAIIGKYKLFRRSVRITFGEAYHPKTDKIEKEIKVLEAKVIELLNVGGNV